jgi:hypothetical protein
MLTEISGKPDITTDQLFHLPDNHAYGVTNAFKEKLDIPYQAIQGAQKAAQAVVAHYDREQALPSRVEIVCIAFPLVVIDAPLFDCKLGNTGEIELQKVESATLLRSGFDTYDSVVEIVHAAALSEFLRYKAELMAKFLKRLKERIPMTLQKLDIAKMVRAKG